jgi:hypothetical protein
MSRIGQLGSRCTVEPNCSGMSVRLAGASVTRDRILDTCEPSCVPEAAKHFFYSCGPQPAGGQEVRGSAGAHLDREARSGAEEHVASLELSSRGGRARSHGTRGSTRAHLGREVWSATAGHVVALKPTSAGMCGPKRGYTSYSLS